MRTYRLKASHRKRLTMGHLCGAGFLDIGDKAQTTEEEQRFYDVTSAQRWTMAATYFGLIAALVFGMHVALAQLQGHGIHPETRTHVQ